MTFYAEIAQAVERRTENPGVASASLALGTIYMFIKFIKGFCLGLVVLGVIILGFYSFFLYPRYSVPVLMYHSFDYHHTKNSVTPEHFEKQMRFIKENGYHVIPLDEAIEGMKKHRQFPHNVLAITMDDGYLNNYTVAYPIFKKYGFPATIFLITNKMGAKNFFQNDSLLMWDQVREMDRHGISFGSHTKNHLYLPAVKDPVILWDEIAGSKVDLEKKLGHPVDYLAYPTGGFTTQIEQLAHKAGYKGALTTNRGYDLLNFVTFYEIDRISIRDADPTFSINHLWSFIRFRAKLSGYYNVFKKGKPGN